MRIVEDNNGQPVILASLPQHADQISESIMQKMAFILNTDIDNATSIIEELMVLGMEYVKQTE